MLPSSIATITESLAGQGYVADIGLSTSLFLALKMGKALLLEGEPGVGKTEVAKTLSRIYETPLIRLQCYEGIDVGQAMYEWNYPRQLLELQARRLESSAAATTAVIYSEEFLLRRPLLQAIDQSHERAPVLLIDELDRADEEFESFLLELLSDFQITIPELGTLRARHRPIIIITSNRTRELHDALKRRCVYHWIEYPSAEKEFEIVCRRIPQIDRRLAARVVAFIQATRRQDLLKPPGVAETLDWAEALGHLDAQILTPDLVDATLGMILKYQDDVDKLRGSLSEELLAQ
ncbi:MAG: MoxR family ATPase [Oscillochloris sp.]|nr:MoxR family ATPase [Oscillochloris sp.]